MPGEPTASAYRERIQEAEFLVIVTNNSGYESCCILDKVEDFPELYKGGRPAERITHFFSVPLNLLKEKVTPSQYLQLCDRYKEESVNAEYGKP